MIYGLEGQEHSQVSLAHPRRTQKQDVGGLGDECKVGQFFDPRLCGGRLCRSSMEGWKEKSNCSRVRWNGRRANLILVES